MTVAAIEAAAAVGSLVVSGVYAVLTWKIARAADLQASASHQQTEYLQSQDRDKSKHALSVLWARATYLQRQLSHLPLDFESAAFARPLWRAEDEEALERAAAAVDAPTVLEAADAARSLENLRKHYARVRVTAESPGATVPPASDYLQPNEWKATRQHAHDMVYLLEATGAEKRISPKSTISDA